MSYPEHDLIVCHDPLDDTLWMTCLQCEAWSLQLTEPRRAAHRVAHVDSIMEAAEAHRRAT